MTTIYNNAEYEPLKEHPDFEISIKYPHEIRHVKSKIVSNTFIQNNFIKINLNSKSFYLHRLIAIQFIPNPENHKYVGHRNNNKHDNRIDNLYWCDRIDVSLSSSKTRFGHKVEFVDTLPDDVKEVKHYEKYELIDGYYVSCSLNQFYLKLKNGKYRIIKVNNHHNKRVVCLYDIDKKRHEFDYNKLLKTD